MISSEKDLPAKEPKNEAGTRFYEENALQERPECDQEAQSKRAQGFKRLKVNNRDADTGQAPETI